MDNGIGSCFEILTFFTKTSSLPPPTAAPHRETVSPDARNLLKFNIFTLKKLPREKKEGRAH
ncbi:hypothetical protein [Geomonas limicola]|uniref:hypothetical protein n=1 Tax=Geomonas limicola TaxID=2740186 RepID=UPI0016080575|nr:hypothetical protein [Geomonas limicola]